MSEDIVINPEWVTKGKTVRQLISELQSFDDQDIEVRISLDDGDSYKPISLVVRDNIDGLHFCGLMNCEHDES